MIRCLLAVSIVCFTPVWSQAAPDRPNVLIVTVDDMNADSIGAYGCPLPNISPNMDRLAKQGVLFEKTYSPHIPTTSAYASMLTGMDCFSTEVVALRHRGGLTKKVKTLPEILRKAGYNTTCVGFGGNPDFR